MVYTFLIPLCGCAAGIWCSSELFTGYTFPAICFGMGFLFWVTARLLSRNFKEIRKVGTLHKIWIFFLFMGIGSIDFEGLCKVSTLTYPDKEQLNITGRIYECRSLASGDIFKLKINKITDSSGNNIDFRNAALLLKTDGLCAGINDIIEFKGVLHKFQAESEHDKKYASLMHHEGIDYYAYIKSDNIIKKGKEKGLKEFFYNIRTKLIIMIEKSHLDRKTRNFMVSILLGDKTFLNHTQRDLFTYAGLGHILALSGLHVGIIFAIFSIIFSPIGLTGRNSLKKSLAIAFTWLYVALTGFSPSTVRAACMATFVILAFFTQRKNSALNALFAATLFILLFNPRTLWNLGLQLSFLSVLFIILLVEKFNVVDRHTHYRIYNFISLVLISCLASGVTWILAAYYFKNVPLLFLPANILILPFMPFFISGAILYVFLLSLNIDFSILRYLLDLFVTFLYDAVKFLSLNGESVINLGVEEAAVGLWLIGILALTISFYSKKQLKFYLLPSSLVCLVSTFLFIGIESPADNLSLEIPYSFTNMEANIITGDKKHKLTFERNTLSKSSFEQLNLLSVDTPLTPEGLESLQNLEKGKINILFVGPRAEFSQIRTLANHEFIYKVVLHSQIGNRMKEDLIGDLSEEAIEKIYSLRENGSFNLSL